MTILAETQRVDGACQLLLVELLLPVCIEKLKYLLDHRQLPIPMSQTGQVRHLLQPPGRIPLADVALTHSDIRVHADR